jgi:flagellar hook-basal body complex protein FliE
MPSPTAAASAYAALARMTDAASAFARGGKANSALGVEAGGPSFNALLTNAIGSVVKAGHTSDAQTQALAAG